MESPIQTLASHVARIIAGELGLSVGDTFAAQVVEKLQDGVLIQAGAWRFPAATKLPLEVGRQVRLKVAETSPSRTILRLLPTPSQPSAPEEPPPIAPAFTRKVKDPVGLTLEQIGAPVTSATRQAAAALARHGLPVTLETLRQVAPGSLDGDLGYIKESAVKLEHNPDSSAAKVKVLPYFPKHSITIMRRAELLSRGFPITPSLEKALATLERPLAALLQEWEPVETVPTGQQVESHSPPPDPLAKRQGGSATLRTAGSAQGTEQGSGMGRTSPQTIAPPPPPASGAAPETVSKPPATPNLPGAEADQPAHPGAPEPLPDSIQTASKPPETPIKGQIPLKMSAPEADLAAIVKGTVEPEKPIPRLGATEQQGPSSPKGGQSVKERLQLELNQPRRLSGEKIAAGLQRVVEAILDTPEGRITHGESPLQTVRGQILFASEASKLSPQAERLADNLAGQAILSAPRQGDTPAAPSLYLQIPVLTAQGLKTVELFVYEETDGNTGTEDSQVMAFRVRMETANLGSVTVAGALRGQQLDLRFEADRKTQSIISKNRSILEDQLKSAGLWLGHFGAEGQTADAAPLWLPPAVELFSVDVEG